MPCLYIFGKINICNAHMCGVLNNSIYESLILIIRCRDHGNLSNKPKHCFAGLLFYWKELTKSFTAVFKLIYQFLDKDYST